MRCVSSASELRRSSSTLRSSERRAANARSKSRPAVAARFKHVPIWAFHGDQDTAVKPRRSREMIDALKAAGGEPKYTEYQGVGHNSWAPTYANPDLYEWLFAQRKVEKQQKAE